MSFYKFLTLIILKKEEKKLPLQKVLAILHLVWCVLQDSHIHYFKEKALKKGFGYPRVVSFYKILTLIILKKKRKSL